MQRSAQIRPAARDRKQRAIRPTRLRAAHPRRGNAEIILPLSLENTIKKASNYTKSMSTQSSKTTKTPSKYRVGMFSAGEARCDRWQEMAHAAQALVAQSAAGSSTKEALAQVEDLFRHLNILEAFHAYPGESLMATLKEALGSGRLLRLFEAQHPHRQGDHHRLLPSLRKCLEAGRGRRTRGQRASDEGLLRHGRPDQALLRSPDR